MSAVETSREEIATVDRMAPKRSVRNGELIVSQDQSVTALFILKAGLLGATHESTGVSR